MTEFLTTEAYLKRFQNAFEAAEKRENKDLQVYLQTQTQRLEILIAQITPKNFWQVLPEVLGIDAKLGLVVELIAFEDFSNEEIIQVVEKDYRTYFKELCGYDLSMEPKHSMIFNVL